MREHVGGCADVGLVPAHGHRVAREDDVALDELCACMGVARAARAALQHAAGWAAGGCSLSCLAHAQQQPWAHGCISKQPQLVRACVRASGTLASWQELPVGALVLRHQVTRQYGPPWEASNAVLHASGSGGASTHLVVWPPCMQPRCAPGTRAMRLCMP